MLIVNPNICTDRTIEIEELLVGHVQRPRSGATTLGGKGVNVARVARAFGSRAVIVTFLPSHDEVRLAALAQDEGATLTGVSVQGEARGATIILEDSGRVTVLNEPGARVTTNDWEKLLVMVQSHFDANSTVVCSGSLPPGSPANSYGRVVELARDRGVRSVVDSSGEVLDEAIKAGADIVSPNLSEAETLLVGGRPENVDPSGPDVVDRAARAVTGLIQRGARHAIVSVGSHGAAFDTDGRVAWCAAPVVNVLNPIGAGDSLVGGMVKALEDGQSWEDAARYGIVTASASCEDRLAGGVDLARVRTLAMGLAPLHVLDSYLLPKVVA
ncbi:MAG TPA: hexose kinase [Acidimicrobiales bacterium]